MNRDRPRTKVLYLEQDLAVRTIFDGIVSRYLPSLELLQASDGKSCLDAFRQHRPGIFITEIRIEGMDGFELIRKIKAEAPDTAVLVITSSSDPVCREKAMAIGVEYFFQKPVDLPTVFAAIEKCLKGR